MPATTSFTQGAYELQCGARRLDNERYAPTLTIVKQVWPTRPREIAVGKDTFATEEEAVAAARAQGLTWVHNYG